MATCSYCGSPCHCSMRKGNRLRIHHEQPRLVSATAGNAAPPSRLFPGHDERIAAHAERVAKEKVGR